MRILVSTSDKTGLLEFLKPLLSASSEIVSTGGTFEFLKKNNLPVVDVAAVTLFPEVLDGRVKTLHPFVHMGLLADKFNAEHMQQLRQHKVKAFDMVVGNLYPFEQAALKADSTLEDLIENIDIGGPSFLRASAKNYKSVIVVSSPLDYTWVQKKILASELSLTDRKKLALKVFSLTSYYDALIVNKLGEDSDEFDFLNLPLKKKFKLRYGENSQQKAEWYVNPLVRESLSDMQIHQGKELSYNNLLDIESAVQLVQLFDQPGCVAVKHNNPCGAAVAEDPLTAALKTIKADSKSIFGGIVAFNRRLDLKTCELFKDIFLECLVAPSFTDEALTYLEKKKNLRVLSLKYLSEKNKFSSANYKSVSGGLLRQEADTFSVDNWKFLSETPNADLLQTMVFGDRVAGALKSNAIAIVANAQTVGLGMGQVNRVDAVKQAIERMQQYCKTEAVNIEQVVLVSDAFFPFPDSIELIAKSGIKWVVQPGGSVQDQAVFAESVKQKVNMVLTGLRHFKH